MSGSFSFVQIQLALPPFEQEGRRKCWNTSIGQGCFLPQVWPGPAAAKRFPTAAPQNLFLGWLASFPRPAPLGFPKTFGQVTSLHQMLCTLPSASPQSPTSHPSSPSLALPCRPPSQFIPSPDLVHLMADVLNVTHSHPLPRSHLHCLLAILSSHIPQDPCKCCSLSSLSFLTHSDLRSQFRCQLHSETSQCRPGFLFLSFISLSFHTLNSACN